MCGATKRSSAAQLESLLDLPIVGEVRGAGYFYALELVKNKDTKESFDDDESETLLRKFLSPRLFEAGLVCRADDRGDPVIQLSPPLIAGPEQFAEIEATLRTVLGRGVEAVAVVKRGACGDPGRGRHHRARAGARSGRGPRGEGAAAARPRRRAGNRRRGAPWSGQGRGRGGGREGRRGVVGCAQGRGRARQQRFVWAQSVGDGGGARGRVPLPRSRRPLPPHAPTARARRPLRSRGAAGRARHRGQPGQDERDGAAWQPTGSTRFTRSM